MSLTGGEGQGHGRTGRNAPLRFALHPGGSSGFLPSFEDPEREHREAEQICAPCHYRGRVGARR